MAGGIRVPGPCGAYRLHHGVGQRCYLADGHVGPCRWVREPVTRITEVAKGRRRARGSQWAQGVRNGGAS